MPVGRWPDGEKLIGFITARSSTVYECNIDDRHFLGLSSRNLDNQKTVYILTLGVVPEFRQRGIASDLVSPEEKGILDRDISLR